MEDRDPWETEPEWTGLGGSEAVSISEDDVNMADKSPRKIVKLVTREKPKAKLGKPLMIRDLVRAQVRAENQLNTPGLKKRKLTDDGNGYVLWYHTKMVNAHWMTDRRQKGLSRNLVLGAVVMDSQSAQVSWRMMTWRLSNRRGRRSKDKRVN